MEAFQTFRTDELIKHVSGKDFQNVNIMEFLFDPDISFYSMYINNEPVLLVLPFMMLEGYGSQ